MRGPPMKHLSELRTMIDDIAKPKNDTLDQQPREVLINGDHNVIVVYAAGAVTINSHVPPPLSEPSDAG